MNQLTNVLRLEPACTLADMHFNLVIHAVVGENLPGLPGFLECLCEEFPRVFRRREMYDDTEF